MFSLEDLSGFLRSSLRQVELRYWLREDSDASLSLHASPYPHHRPITRLALKVNLPDADVVSLLASAGPGLEALSVHFSGHLSCTASIEAWSTMLPIVRHLKLVTSLSRLQRHVLVRAALAAL